MEDADLNLLENKLDLLIQRIARLESENRQLLDNERAWRQERAHLIEKNEMARLKVESMISRLKALEQDS
ncbi:TIGR02449 family protein [Stutzerimonas tarimensis]|uniref:TIGR02449 family protein n=1 Tax=Stutzerimonas tarimensis TaxID=1507735 RepID=A0ABV7T7R3_9GAMM